LPEESWAEIEGFPHYMISNFGFVRNRKTDQLLQPYDNGDGSLKVDLYNEKGRRSFYIHQLVAGAYFHDFSLGMHVTHVNGDNYNNRSHNLRLRKGTSRERRENQRDSWGKRVRVIELDEVYRSVRDCANHIGGDYSSIYQCLRGQRKHHLGFTFEWV